MTTQTDPPRPDSPAADAMEALRRALDLMDVARLSVVNALDDLRWRHASGASESPITEEPLTFNEQIEVLEGTDPLHGRLLTLRDAGEWLGMTEKQVRTYVRRGAIPAVRLRTERGEIRVPSAALWQFVRRLPVE